MYVNVYLGNVFLSLMWFILICFMYCMCECIYFCCVIYFGLFVNLINYVSVLIRWYCFFGGYI